MLNFEVYELVITAVVAPMALWGVAEIRKSSKARAKETKKTEEITKAIEELRHYVDRINTKQDQMLERLEDAENTTILEIRARMSQSHRFFTDQGHIDKYNLQSLSDVYDAYKKKVKNTYVKTLMDDIKELKVIG
jgi:pyruvate/2-oxoglutarate dehydrogenase complex dihydrolipoamide dehydrogenase (E3) component